jgi:hypothetical protein
MTTNDARCTCEIKSRLHFNFKEEISEVLHLKHSSVFERSEITGKLEVWCWKRMEVIWSNSVRSEEVLHGIKECLTYSKNNEG